MIKILIADDHAVVRRGLKQILAETDDLIVKGEAADATETIERVRVEEWDVVVLDITMPGSSGLEVLKEIRRLRPKLVVLVLTMHAEDQFAVRALRAGAAGYLTKDGAPEELVTAVRKVAAGGRYLTATLAEKLAQHLSEATDQPPHEILSDREFQVLRLIASGKTVQEIADSLTLSPKTVSTYRARLLEKMEMRTNAELTHYAIKSGLVG